MSQGRQVDLGEAFNFGLDRLKNNPGMCIGFGATLFVLAIALGLLFGGVNQVVVMTIAKINPKLIFAWLPVEWALSAIINSVPLALMIPGFFACVASDAQGGKSAYGDLFKCMDKFVNAFIASLLSMLAIMVGTILCIIPGILVSPVLMISLYLVWKGESGMDAFKKSFKILLDNKLAGLFIILLNLLAGVGVIACCVGVFATMPIGYAAIWFICERICGDGSEEPSEEQPQVENSDVAQA